MIICICLEHIAREFQFIVIEETPILLNRVTLRGGIGKRLPCAHQIGFNLLPKFGKVHVHFCFHTGSWWLSAADSNQRVIVIFCCV